MNSRRKIFIRKPYWDQRIYEKCLLLLLAYYLDKRVIIALAILFFLAYYIKDFLVHVLYVYRVIMILIIIMIRFSL